MAIITYKKYKNNAPIRARVIIIKGNADTVAIKAYLYASNNNFKK